jgi:hypothetical protein
MSLAEEMAQFISLCSLVQDVNLNDAADSIIWRWTMHSSYTAKSACVAQFRGAFCTFSSMTIRKAQAEGKHHLFCLVNDSKQDSYYG